MADTSIEWADKTWNPLLGCERVSDGCDRCYAINTATIRAGNPRPAVAAAFAGLTERRDGRLDWTGRVNLLHERLNQPLKWRKPSRIFVNSQADLFHDSVPTQFIVEVFARMARARQHTFQLLTKRHGRMRSLLNDDLFQRDVGLVEAALTPTEPLTPEVWPLPNLWLGVSVEDQKWADIRIRALLDTPAAVRWVSAEPLLGPFRLTPDDHAGHERDFNGAYGYDCLDCSTEDEVVPWYEQDAPDGLGWVVCGGESGPGARPMHPAWARRLRDDCLKARVPFLFKQWGQHSPVIDKPRAGDLWVATDGATEAWQPGDGHVRAGGGDFVNGNRVLMRRGHKGSTGRELDGQTWDQYPSPLPESEARVQGVA